MNRILAVLALLLAAQTCLAVRPFTEHTFRLSEGEEHPDVEVEAVAWLAGNWVGTGLGGEFEASWSPPSAGSMVGTFKLIRGGEVEFYEILVLSRLKGVLGLKVRHFTRDFVSWEDKYEYTNFQIVRVDEDAVHFGGISFYRRSADEMDAFIVFRSEQGEREAKLTYRRVP